jgi:hypothetical protein
LSAGAAQAGAIPDDLGRIGTVRGAVDGCAQTSLIDHSSDVRFLIEKIQVVMGQDCQVRFQKVDDISTNASGKYPYVVNRRSGRPPESALH